MPSMARQRLRWIAPLGALATGACFATRQDVRLLQTNLAQVQMQSQQADSARRVELDRVIAQLAGVDDSLRLLSARTQRWQGDVRGDLYSLGQQLIQIQELTGQSQARLQEIRARLEAQRQMATVPGPAGGVGGGAGGAATGAAGGTAAGGGAGTSGSSDTSRASTQPGPNQLFELALDQLRRGSTGAARAGFQDLLRQYPGSDVAPDAEFYLADTFAREGNNASADSIYQQVVSQYPASPRAATALYRHGLVLEGAGKTQQARATFDQVVQKYPRSDEAILAKDQLRELK